MLSDINMSKLMQTPLFRGMNNDEIRVSLDDLSARTKGYRKGSFILHAGDTTDYLGIVLSGSVTIESNEIWGNTTILSHVGKNGIFAETYAMLKDTVLLVDVRANEDCKVLFLNLRHLQNSHEDASWKRALTSNLLMISADKNLTLSGRSFHTAPKTIRGRVLSYLNSVSLQKKSNEFDIPFDRQQLADYLNVDRTALSKELGRMRDEGLIVCRKNHFIITSG